jgi:integrase
MTAAPAGSGARPDRSGEGRDLAIDTRGWDRRADLLDGEAAAILALGPVRLRRIRAKGIPQRTARHWNAITRLTVPLDAARAVLHHRDDASFRRAGKQAVAIVLQHCADTGCSYWSWTSWDWARLCGSSAREFAAAGRALATEASPRVFLVALAYLLGGFTDFHHLGSFDRQGLARLVFGRAAAEAPISTIAGILGQWGYQETHAADHRLRGIISQALLVNRSPRLDDLTTEAFIMLASHPATTGRITEMLPTLQRAVASLGHCDPPAPAGIPLTGIEGTAPEWAEYVERWHATSTLTPKVRGVARILMAKTGRWLAAEHPEITGPGQWTRQTCADWVAAVDRMAVGDYVQRSDITRTRAGTPFSPRTKEHTLVVTRAFFRDCQEWEWIPRRFDPARALATPRSVQALIGTNPRVIADQIWAKLMWAGLNLEAGDLPATGFGGTYYPLELVRALTVTWLFSGLRSDEITRLHVGCIRWQHDGQPIPGDARDILAGDAICLLDVPVHKTGTAFTKPVDPLVGQAIQAWQAVRPAQPSRLDRKTSERVNVLFSIRAQPVGKHYINNTIIPALCAKAGVPAADVRGNITSHRARSTIASQLYNAKEPMTLFELQAWLGHKNPASTQHYAKITPNTLSKAYTEAGYFARNIRTIEVLLDRDAVASGAAAAGQPWQHYDLGHGYCTYTFFEQCPHRMACAKCDFYTPKDSTKAQLLQARDNLQHMLTSIPLTDEERTAVDDGQTALDSLLGRLADIPTPAGATPRELGTSPARTHLPIIDVRPRETG